MDSTSLSLMVLYLSTFTSMELLEFQHFLQSLNPLNLKGDGFIRAFWEEVFNCSLSDAAINEEQQETCSGDEELENIPGPNFEMSMTGQSYSIYNVVHAIAHALEAMLSSRAKHRSIENEGKRDHLNLQRWQLLPFLRSVSYNNRAGEEVFFNSNSELATGFDIINWLIFPNQSISKIKVGSIAPKGLPGKEVSIDKEKITWQKQFNQVLPLARCNDQGTAGKRKKESHSAATTVAQAQQGRFLSRKGRGIERVAAIQLYRTLTA